MKKGILPRFIPARMGFFIIISFMLIASGCERRAWEEAQEQNTISGYQAYLEKYPDGEHKAQAQGLMAGLALAEARSKNTISAYDEFLARFPGARKQRQQVLLHLENLVDLEVSRLTPEQIEKKEANIETEFGTIRFRFFPDVAPNHCRNFIKLARIHFYDGLTFHQIIPDMEDAETKSQASIPWPNGLIRGGAPGGDPQGGPGYTISPEFNDRPHIKGTVAMYHGNHPNSAGSQFYICLKALPGLDGKYTVFGQVTGGMDVLDAIAKVPNSGPPMYRPREKVIIKKVYIRDRE
jgi:cyclophilin family peptidyl-prolyl cis-trans isomerase